MHFHSAGEFHNSMQARKAFKELIGFYVAKFESR